MRFLPWIFAAVVVAEDKKEDQKKKDEKEEEDEKFHLPRWGEEGYWVKLNTLQVSGGVFDPPFVPNFEGPYDVTIQNPDEDVAVIMPELNIRKFPPRYPPMIHIDHVELKYSPVRPIRYEIPLNATKGPIDHTVEIHVSDPEGGIGGPSMVYYLRLLQPPHPDVVRLTGIKIYNSYGVEVDQDRSTQAYYNKYKYILGDSDSYADIYIDCDPSATYLRFNGEIYYPGHSYRQYMAHHRQEVIVACVFKSDRWTGKDELARTYLVQILKPPPDIRYVKFDLMVAGTDGNCKEKHAGHYECFNWKEELGLIGHWNSTNDVYVTDESGRKVSLMNGLPTIMKMKTGSLSAKIVIVGEKELTRELPLLIKTDLKSGPGQGASDTVQIDMSKLVFVNPTMGEGHCSLAQQEANTYYCQTDLRVMHLMVVYGRPDGITASFVHVDGDKLCDVQLGLPAPGISVASGKAGSTLRLILKKHGEVWREYTIVLHTTLAADGTHYGDGDFLPSSSQLENKPKTVSDEDAEEKIAELQAAQAMRRMDMIDSLEEVIFA